MALNPLTGLKDDSPSFFSEPKGRVSRDVFGNKIESGSEPLTLQQKLDAETERAKSYDIDIPTDNGQEKFKLWDLLEWARYPISNMIYEGVRQNKEGENLDIGKMLQHAVAGALLKEKYSSKDIMNELYPDAPEWVKSVVGFAGDVITDPTTYLSFGATAGKKLVAEAGQKAGTAVAKSAKELAELAAKEGVQSAAYKNMTEGLVKQWGGKNWEQALQNMRREMVKEGSGYGLKVGLPFANNTGKLIKAGGRLDAVSAIAKTLGAGEDTVKGIKNLQTTVGGLPGIRGVKRAFSNLEGLKPFDEVKAAQNANLANTGRDNELSFEFLKKLDSDIGAVTKSPALESITKGAKTEAEKRSKILSFLQDWRDTEGAKKKISEKVVGSEKQGLNGIEKEFSIPGKSTLKYEEEDGIAIISDVTTEEKYRNKGYATAVIEKFLQYADSKGLAVDMTGFLPDGEKYLKPLMAKLVPQYKNITWMGEEFGDISKKISNTAIKTLPEELRTINDDLTNVMKNTWSKFIDRGMIKEKKEIQDYFPRFYVNAGGQTAIVKDKAFKTTGGFMKNRSFKTLEEAKAAGYTPADPFTSLQIYLEKANNVINTHDMVKDIVDKYGHVMAKGERVRNLGSEMSQLTIPGFEKAIVPREIGRVLNEVTTVITDSEESAKVAKWIQNVSTFWKKQATIYNPGFHLRNEYSNLWTLGLKDGFSPSTADSLAKATKIFTHPKSDEIMKIGDKSKKISEWLDDFRRSGVHTGSFTAPEFGVGEDLARKFGKTVNKVDRIAAAPGNFFENTTRMASAINDMKKGIDITEAAKNADKYFLNYSDLTKFEKNIKKFIPFYTWMRRNLSNQLQFAFNNPGRYTALTIKPLRNLDALSEEDKKNLPEYMKEDMWINPIGLKTASGKPLMVNPNLPFQELQAASRPLKYIGDLISGGISPLIKTPTELVTNRSMFNGRPIAQNELSRSDVPVLLMPIVEAMPASLRKSLNIEKNEFGRWQADAKAMYALNSYLPLLKTGEGTYNAITGNVPTYREENAPFNILSRTAGIKGYAIDPKYNKDTAMAAKLQSLSLQTSDFETKAFNEFLRTIDQDLLKTYTEDQMRKMKKAWITKFREKKARELKGKV